MSNQLQRDIARKIIEALYFAWAQNTIISLFSVRDEGKWDDGVFDTVVDKLEHRHGLIKSYGSSYTYEITATGVLYAEDNEMVPRAEVEKHQLARRHVLAFLAHLYEREGSQCDELIGTICEGASLGTLEMMEDILLLTELGYLEATSSSSLRITEEGLRHYRGTDLEAII